LRAEIIRTSVPRIVNTIESRLPALVCPSAAYRRSSAECLSSTVTRIGRLKKGCSHSARVTWCSSQFLAVLPPSQSKPEQCASSSGNSAIPHVYCSNIRWCVKTNPGLVWRRRSGTAPLHGPRRNSGSGTRPRQRSYPIVDRHRESFRGFHPQTEGRTPSACLAAYASAEPPIGPVIPSLCSGQALRHVRSVAEEPPTSGTEVGACLAAG
jgi:hypothetical protein